MRPNGIFIVQPRSFMNNDELKNLRSEILRQMEEGLVIVDSRFDLYFVLSSGKDTDNERCYA